VEHFICPDCGLSINSVVARSDRCPRCWRREGRRVTMTRRVAPLRAVLAAETSPVRAQLRAFTRSTRQAIANDQSHEEAHFIPIDDPREQADWSRLSDRARAQAMAKYLSEQASGDADARFSGERPG
jgi:predicted amidophosphoribosyltransferase